LRAIAHDPCAIGPPEKAMDERLGAGRVRRYRA
jgi:hypothetical protein